MTSNAQQARRPAGQQAGQVTDYEIRWETPDSFHFTPVKRAELTRTIAEILATPGAILWGVETSGVTDATAGQRAEESLTQRLNPPHHATSDESHCNVTDEVSGYICTAQAGHDGPDHIAFCIGGEYRRWQ